MAEQWVRLKPVFFNLMKEGAWPVRKSLAPWLKDRGLKQDAYEMIAKLRRNDPVPFLVGESLVEFMRLRRKWENITVEKALEPAMPVDRGWWSWGTVADMLLDGFRPVEETFVHRPEVEIPRIAEQVAGYVGRLNSLPNVTDPVRFGEQVMGRTLSQTAAWLMELRRVQRHSILHACHPQRRNGAQTDYLRVATVIGAGVTENWFDRFSLGQVADHQMTADDLQDPSPFALIDFIASDAEIPGVTAEQREVAEVNCVMYMLAYFTRCTRHPVICSVAGTPLARDRLHRFGFRETGHCVPGTVEPVMVFRNPPRKTALLVKISFMLHRIANRDEWKHEKRSR